MKKLRIAFIGIVGLFFFSILLASSVRNIYMAGDNGKSRLGFLAQPIKFMAETPSIIKTILSAPEFIVTNSEAKGGLDYSNGVDTKSYPKLLVSYKQKEFGQEFELLDLKNGKSIKKWSPDNASLYEQAFNEDNPRKPSKGSDLYFMHPLMSSDSSLMFTSQLTSLLAKIDKKGELLWLKNDKTYHHTLESNNNGKIYTCTRPFISGKYDFLPGEYDEYKHTLLDDTISIIEENTGDEIFSKSVIEILVENGYKKLLLYKGQIISDQIHLNDIQPALTDSEFWKKDDLLISCRNLSAVFLYRPSTNKILWLQHGPWTNQHDADFYENDKIVVFGNDVIREESIVDERLTHSNLSFTKEKQHNEIYVYNFVNDSTSTPYSRLMSKEKITTYTSGRCDILENGDVIIEETNNGRIIIGDSINKKVEYVKRLDEGHISSLFWSRIIN
ncbi:arylsulfotransferase family protein [Aurantibacter sp.]|uniref:arylsulfotransferase family protein n=1 Tax=Aurantibacter sp. TaxID=2807103 RepID=UPI003264F5FD